MKKLLRIVYLSTVFFPVTTQVLDFTVLRYQENCHWNYLAETETYFKAKYQTTKMLLKSSKTAILCAAPTMFDFLFKEKKI